MTTSAPQATDFHEAVQHPSHTFTDPRLKQGSVATNPLGLPLALSGGFALIYIVTLSGKKYAVRCFHRYVPNIEAKYAAISKALKGIRGGYFVGFDFQPSGIVVKRQVCPVVLMDWVEGPTLGNYLDTVYSNKEAVGRLRTAFHRLDGYLTANRVAHGDIQNGNVLVVHHDLVLIDYDGVYVEGLGRGQGTEVGHKHFQHPGRTAANFGPEMDRFSLIAVDVSLQALQADASLYLRYREGGETILFKANDYADPSNSEVFKRILSIPDTKSAAERFANICRAPYLDVPTLTDFLAGRNIPTGSTHVVTAGSIEIRTSRAVPKPRYIGAYCVLDATDYRAGLAQVGNRVELIGRIVEVKRSATRYSNRPYAFVNFGDWRSNIIKLTIWSEGLARFSGSPGMGWIDKWVSVVGLMDPPYSNTQWGYTHLSITVSDPGQIQFIDEAEARFRLGSVRGDSNQVEAGEVRRENGGRAKSKSGRGSGSETQSDLPAKLGDVRRQSDGRAESKPGSSSASETQSDAPAKFKSSSSGGSASQTHNEAVLGRIRAASRSESTSPSSGTRRTSPYQSPHTGRHSTVTKKFNWGCLILAIAIVIVLLIALSK
jgi:hypothetical protein